jgi:predicted transcriptional regulator
MLGNISKKYILTGFIAIVLAVLAIVATPLIFKYKTLPVSVIDLSPKEKVEQEKIKKEFEKLEEMRKSQNAKQPAQEDIQREFNELEKQREESGLAEPTPEQIQAEFDKLEQK